MQDQAFRTWLSFARASQAAYEARFIVKRPGPAGTRVDIRKLTRDQLDTLKAGFEREIANAKMTDKLMGSKKATGDSQLERDLGTLTRYMASK